MTNILWSLGPIVPHIPPQPVAPCVSLWYLCPHEAVSQPVQVGLALAEIVQVNILELVAVKLPQDQRHVIVAGRRSRQGQLRGKWVDSFRPGDQAGHVASLGQQGDPHPTLLQTIPGPYEAWAGAFPTGRG